MPQIIDGGFRIGHGLGPGRRAVAGTLRRTAAAGGAGCRGIGQIVGFRINGPDQTEGDGISHHMLVLGRIVGAGGHHIGQG